MAPNQPRSAGAWGGLRSLSEGPQDGSRRATAPPRGSPVASQARRVGALDGQSTVYSTNDSPCDEPRPTKPKGVGEELSRGPDLRSWCGTREDDTGVVNNVGRRAEENLQHSERRR